MEPLSLWVLDQSPLGTDNRLSAMPTGHPGPGWQRRVGAQRLSPWLGLLCSHHVWV